MIDTLNLQAGSFKMVLPYRWQEWLGYVIFGIVTIFGILMTFSGVEGSIDNLLAGLFIMGVGCFGLSACTPGSHQKDLHNLRNQAIDKAEIEAKAKQSGLTVDN